MATRRSRCPLRPNLFRRLTPLLFTTLTSISLAQQSPPTVEPQAADTVVEIARPSEKTDLNTLRERYRDARKAFAGRDNKRFNQLLPQLAEYPLYPYLLYSQHLRQLSKLKPEQLQNFSSRYGDTPLSKRLKRRWLANLGKKGRWQTLVDHYQPTLANTTLQCQKLWADYQLGNRESALNEVQALWLVGSSQPKACDRLFNQWIKAGRLTEKVAWERFWLALERNNTGLAKYLTRYLNAPDLKKLAETALRLHRKPTLLERTQLTPDQPAYNRLVLNTLNRLSRSKPAQALELLDNYTPFLSLTDDAMFSLKRRFAMRLLKRYHPDSESWLAKIDPEYSDLELLEWRIRNQLQRGNWHHVDKLLDQLPSSERFKDRWRYWKGRSIEETTTNASERAREIYNELSQERSFYGFLAADKTGRGYSLNNKAEPADRHQLGLLEAKPGLIRARELYYQGQRSEARREWRLATRSFDQEQHYLAAHLARRWGWFEQSIRAAIAARRWDDLRLRFPAPYSQKIGQNAAQRKIDQQWIFAVARQESAFMADARSRAGAVGLMQLMPRTAKQTAKSIRLKYRGAHQLTDPDINIRLGSAYLSKMLKLHDDNRVLATAAYNAGPYRVKQWLELRGDLPIDVWIETIPFDETRQYVQNVLSYAVIYSDMLGQEQVFLRPNEIKPPTLAQAESG